MHHLVQWKEKEKVKVDLIYQLHGVALYFGVSYTKVTMNNRI